MQVKDNCDEGLDDEEQLTPADLLCTDSYFVQGLQNLHLDADFGTTILATAEHSNEHALDRAAEITVALAAASTRNTQRQQLALQSYHEKVQSRPNNTSSAYASGVRHFQVLLV